MQNCISLIPDLNTYLCVCVQIIGMMEKEMEYRVDMFNK